LSEYEGLLKEHQPDWQALLNNVRGNGTPKRVHHMELFHDPEIRDAIAHRFHLMENIPEGDPDRERKKLIAVNRFCGFDHVSVNLVGIDMPMRHCSVQDTADMARVGGRAYMEEHAGPITTWEEFERYPWPNPLVPEAARELEWFSQNLPEDMCIVAHTGHFCEFLAWLMGYEALCYALHDQRDLVRAIADRILELHQAEMDRFLSFDRVKLIWGSDDMGFKTGTLISPEHMREFVLQGHKKLADRAHEAGRLYLLHSCGRLDQIMGDLIDHVRIDAKHSFEDTIEDVRQDKAGYGQRIALLGGIDVDFLCRANEQAIRQRVRETLDVCMLGGRYCLGSGNSVANYIPLDNYLAMIDEGRLYSN